MHPEQTLSPFSDHCEAHFGLIQLRYSANRDKMFPPLPLASGIARKHSYGERKVEYVQ